MLLILMHMHLCLSSRWKLGYTIKVTFAPKLLSTLNVNISNIYNCFGGTIPLCCCLMHNIYTYG